MLAAVLENAAEFASANVEARTTEPIDMEKRPQTEPQKITHCLECGTCDLREELKNGKPHTVCNSCGYSFITMKQMKGRVESHQMVKIGFSERFSSEYGRLPDYKNKADVEKLHWFSWGSDFRTMINNWNKK